MKIAFIGDTHFGYPRFKEDALKQGRKAFLLAQQKADIIIHVGDFFHTKNPSFETLKEVLEILKEIKKPIYVIEGNHERTSRDKVSVLQLLETLGAIKRLRFGENKIENIYIYAMHSVPEDLAKKALEKLKQNQIKNPNILVIHQDIKEFTRNQEAISIEDLYGFELIVDGHMHKHRSALNKKFIITGSTVVTQLKEEETGEKGIIIYDTEKKEWEFLPIETRKFLFFRIESSENIRETIEKIIEENKEAIIKIKIIGDVKVNINDLQSERVFIDIQNTIKKIKIEKVETLDGISLLKKNGQALGFYDPELFEILQEEPEYIKKYLERYLQDE